jgi:hypothetical protein
MNKFLQIFLKKTLKFLLSVLAIILIFEYALKERQAQKRITYRLTYENRIELSNRPLKYVFENISDERLQDMAANAKEQLREKPLLDRTNKGIDFSTVLTMIFRVLILAVLALIFATGIEILIFKDQINQVLEQMKTLYQPLKNMWMCQ